METYCIMYNTYLEPRIFTVKQLIVSYQCRTALSEPNQTMGQMSRWPNLDILLNRYRCHHCFLTLQHLLRLHLSPFLHPLHYLPHFPLQNRQPLALELASPW
jgi:hypothetical protein